MTERQYITAGIFFMAVGMLTLAAVQPELWNVELFKVLLQAVIISGLINMVLAFHYSANKSDEAKVENTGKAFEAITATANAGGTKPDVTLQPGETAQAASGDAKETNDAP